MKATTYDLIDINRDPRTGAEIECVIQAGLAKAAAKKLLIQYRAGNHIGTDMVRTVYLRPSAA